MSQDNSVLHRSFCKRRGFLCFFKVPALIMNCMSPIPEEENPCEISREKLRTVDLPSACSRLQ